jgi:PST family polysaccharide transporter
MMFPIQSINAPLARVMLPVLARLQDEPERYRTTYLLALRAIALCSVPGVMAAAMCSDRLVPFLLGRQWADASPIFFWLSLAAITQPISNTTGWLFISSGRTGELFRWSLISMPITVAGFAAGLPWGARGVAEAYFITQAVRIPILYRWCTRNSPVRMVDLYSALIPTLAGGGVAWLIVAMVSHNLQTVPLFLLALVSSYVSSVAAQAVTPGGRLALNQTRRLLISSFFAKKTGKATLGAV